MKGELIDLEDLNFNRGGIVVYKRQHIFYLIIEESIMVLGKVIDWKKNFSLPKTVETITESKAKKGIQELLSKKIPIFFFN